MCGRNLWRVERAVGLLKLSGSGFVVRWGLLSVLGLWCDAVTVRW